MTFEQIVVTSANYLLGVSRHCVVSRQYFHGLVLGVEGYCLGLGLDITVSVLVSVLISLSQSWSRS